MLQVIFLVSTSCSVSYPPVGKAVGWKLLSTTIVHYHGTVHYNFKFVATSTINYLVPLQVIYYCIVLKLFLER
jgi:hypothetical protein